MARFFVIARERALKGWTVSMIWTSAKIIHVKMVVYVSIEISRKVKMVFYVLALVVIQVSKNKQRPWKVSSLIIF